MFHLVRAGSSYEIWAVRPMAENTAYAMKWLPRGENYTRLNVAGLRHEFSVGKTLDHPEVITVHEYGTCRDGAFLVMELFRTPNLKQWIHQGLKHLHYRITDILMRAAEGLGHLHEKGWVHRDVKPDNFLLAEDGEMRLIDFNLAQRRQSGLGKLLPGRGKVQGTQSYIAPEQIRGQPVDHRADIYSFGCVVHELVTGKPPFTATSSNELLNKHLKTKPPSLTVSDKNVEPAFAELVQRMLAKDPQERPQSLADVDREFQAQPVFRITPKPPSDDAPSPDDRG